MDIRDRRQAEAVTAYLQSDKRSIINACPRFGKIRVALKIIREVRPLRVLLLAPRVDIFKGWDEEFVKMNHISVIWHNITYTSIKKIVDMYDFVILDEPHEMSVNQQVALAAKLKDYKGPILGLTGTLTDKTKNELYDSLTLDTCYAYSIADGVDDGILADYEIFIHEVPLDDKVKRYGKANTYTEKSWFDASMRIKQKATSVGTAHMMNLRMISIIQGSLAKRNKTIGLLNEFENERVLVFCGLTEIADSLGIPVYHSKSKEKDLFLDFCVGGEGGTNQLATIKMMQAGVTINPINKGIVNYMSGNPEDSAQKICRFLGFEYDNPSKKAEIHIVTSNEKFEKVRLKTGLAFFDPAKITYKF